MLKVIELFAGIGAQAQALKESGIKHEVIGISEIDKYALKVYENLHGKVNNLGDITKIDKIPQADLWTYSFPCTDISISGKMKGFDKGSNTGSSLLWEVQRLLEISKNQDELPRFLLMENVKNIVSKRFLPLFQEWIDYLSSLGYKSFYKILNAKDHGVPQNRERCFMLSIRDYNGEFIFPEKEELKIKLGDLLENNVDEKYYLSTKMINCFTDMKDRNGLFRGLQFTPKYAIKDKIARTVTTKAGTRPCDNFIIEPVITLDGKVIVPQATKDGYAIAEIGDGIYTNRCISKRGVVQKDKIPTLKTSANDIAVIVTKDTDNYIQWEQDGWFDIECRAYKEEKISGALNTRGHMKVLTNDVAIRRLTPRECFRLMGWKDVDIDKAFSSGVSDTQLYKMAGNSIVVNCLTKIFESLNKIIKEIEKNV